MSSASTSRIIETELVRKHSWESIRSRVLSLRLEDENGRLLNLKENSNLMLRYLFNKIITRTSEDDPVMITSESSIAKQQVVEDFDYHRVINCEPDKFSTLLETGLIEGKKAVDCIQAYDQSIIYEAGNGSSAKLRYKKVIYEDIGGLATANREYCAEAIALQIRYTYLRLMTHGLANDYAGLGYKPNDAVEAFASAFNHYFTRYYSAFPDLETCFGSLGSFFAAELRSELMMINPPFDLSIMKEMIRRVTEALDNEGEKTFHLTFPAWLDVKEFMSLETHKYTVKFTIIPKDKTRFIDHMRGGKVIKPCNILEVIMTNK